MIEGSPIQDKMNSLPFIVRDYLELGEEVDRAHDEEERMGLREIRRNLIEEIRSTPELKEPYFEFVIFRDSEVKKHE